MGYATPPSPQHGRREGRYDNPRPISDAALVGMLQRNQKTMHEHIEQLLTERDKLRERVAELEADNQLWKSMHEFHKEELAAEQGGSDEQ